MTISIGVAVPFNDKKASGSLGDDAESSDKKIWSPTSVGDQLLPADLQLYLKVFGDIHVL